MHTIPHGGEKRIARVAVNVRLYFDVPIEADTPEASIQLAARAELERAADDDLLRLRKLQFPNVYSVDCLSAVRPQDFEVCQICAVEEANRETRFAL